MIIPYITFLPIDNPHVNPVDIGITIQLIPVRENVIEIDVVAIKTYVSIDFNIVVNVVNFFILLVGFVVFIFEVCNQLFDVVDILNKNFYII